MRWIWDWAKYHDRHNSKSIRVTKLFFCQNDPPGPYEYIILTKEQFGRSYIFWTMPIIIFSPVSNSSNHTLSKMGQIKKKRHYITLNSPQNGIIICLIYFWFDLSHFRSYDSSIILAELKSKRIAFEIFLPLKNVLISEMPSEMRIVCGGVEMWPNFCISICWVIQPILAS